MEILQQYRRCQILSSASCFECFRTGLSYMQEIPRNPTKGHGATASRITGPRLARKRSAVYYTQYTVAYCLTDPKTEHMNRSLAVVDRRKPLLAYYRHS